MGKIKTYNPKEVTIALGNHIVAGYADDSFITIDPNGDGVTKKVGCDGEIVRSISPDDTYIVKLTVLQTSETNSFLQNRFKQDRQTGDGMFPILIKDLKGGMARQARIPRLRQRVQQPRVGTAHRLWRADRVSNAKRPSVKGGLYRT